MGKTNIVDWNTITNFVIDSCVGYGIPREEAEICADVLLESDKRGIESHGVNRFKPVYLDRIKAGIQQATVLARLKNKAKESGRSYQLCMQLFCHEEFLRRLEKSEYAENLVLKGGLFIYSLTDFDSRVTVDVDFLLRKIPNTPEQLKVILEKIIAVDTGNDFVTFEIKDIAPIAVAKKYAGIGASIIARIKNTKTPFSIDFGVGDIIVPKQEKRKIPTQLSDFDAFMNW